MLVEEFYQNLGQCVVLEGNEDKCIWKDKEYQAYTVK